MSQAYRVNLVHILASNPSWCLWGLANVSTESSDQGRFSEKCVMLSLKPAIA